MEDDDDDDDDNGDEEEAVMIATIHKLFNPWESLGILGVVHASFLGGAPWWLGFTKVNHIHTPYHYSDTGRALTRRSDLTLPLDL